MLGTENIFDKVRFGVTKQRTHRKNIATSGPKKVQDRQVSLLTMTEDWVAPDLVVSASHVSIACWQPVGSSPWPQCLPSDMGQGYTCNPVGHHCVLHGLLKGEKGTIQFCFSVTGSSQNTIT